MLCVVCCVLCAVLLFQSRNRRSPSAQVQPSDVPCSVYHIFLIFTNKYTLCLPCKSITFVVLNV